MLAIASSWTCYGIGGVLFHGCMSYRLVSLLDNCGKQFVVGGSGETRGIIILDGGSAKSLLNDSCSVSLTSNDDSIELHVRYVVSMQS